MATSKKTLKALKSNRSKLLDAADMLAGVQGREADFQFALSQAEQIDRQLKLAKREYVKVREPDLYGEGSPNSIVADSVSAQLGVLAPGMPNALEARARLEKYNRYDVPKQQAKQTKKCERAASDFGVTYTRDGFPTSVRALSAEGTTNGGAFVPTLFMTSEWAEAARANSVATAITRTLPLPDGCDQIVVPAIYASGDVNGNAQLGGENTPIAANGITKTANQVIVGVRQYSVITWLSLQLLQRGGAYLDTVFTQDAQAGIAEAIDEDLISGSGQPEAVIPGVGTVAGEILGLVNWSGITSATYTSSSPAVAGILGAINTGIENVDQARRRPPQSLLMTPDRYHQLAGNVTTSGLTQQLLGVGDDDQPVKHSADILGFISGIPVYGAYGCGYDYGSGADQDIVVVNRNASDALLLQGQPTFNFIDSGYGANSLSVGFVARVYVAFGLRISSSVCVVGGTGFVRVNN